jgi:cyanobactin maturation PatA/PatG family protease
LLAQGVHPLSEPAQKNPCPDPSLASSEHKRPIMAEPAAVVPSATEVLGAPEQHELCYKSTADTNRELHLMDQTVQSTNSPTCSAAATASQVAPSDCGCGGKGSKPPQLVFALGKLSFDYGTRQRRDYFYNDMKKVFGGSPSIDDTETLLKYLGNNQGNFKYLTSIIWTLKLDETIIYAIKPMDAYAADIYGTLVGILLSQLEPGKSVPGFEGTGEGVERVSVPGVISGQARLFTGETVPVIIPDSRGIYFWTIKALITAVKEALSSAGRPESPEGTEPGIRTFLERVYYELRNLGLTPQERALNFAATDALRVSNVFHSVLVDPRFQGFELDNIQVVPSPICRPESDCYDVELKFFNPTHTLASSRVFRITVDVSDVVPVAIGEVRHWSKR